MSAVGSGRAPSGVCALDWNAIAYKLSMRDDSRSRDNASRSEYVLIRREVARLYHILCEQEASGLVDKVSLCFSCTRPKLRL